MAARSPAHRTLSPVRIYCLTSRLPEIGCSDLTLGSTEKHFKDFAAALPPSVPRAHARPRLLSPVPGAESCPLTLRSPLPTPLPLRLRAPHPLTYDGRTIQRKTQIKKHELLRKPFHEEFMLFVQTERKRTIIKMTKGHIASDFSLLPNDTI